LTIKNNPANDPCLEDSTSTQEFSFHVRDPLICQSVQHVFNSIGQFNLNPMEMSLVIKAIFDYARTQFEKTEEHIPVVVFDSLFASIVLGDDLLKQLQAIQIHRSAGIPDPKLDTSTFH
jgi:hypothetical protein